MVYMLFIIGYGHALSLQISWDFMLTRLVPYPPSDRYDVPLTMMNRLESVLLACEAEHQFFLPTIRCGAV